METEIRVLHVDDEPDFTDLAAIYLQRASDRLTVESATSADEALSTLSQTEFDCVISDYDMPGQNGLEFLQAVRTAEYDLPFILFTGKGSEEVASEAVAAGATDYLQKRPGTEQYELLANRITNAVEQNRSTQRAANLERIRRMIQDVNQVLVRAETREEIERRVCQIISDSDPYLFAWIGEHDAEAQTVEPRTAAGIEEDYLEAIEITTDESQTGQGPTARAVRTQELAVLQNIPEAPEYGPWRDAALERGYRSSAAIPLAHSNSLYGVLNVYTDQIEAFDDREQDLLAELGADIAHALHSQEMQRTLQRERGRFEKLVEGTKNHAIFMLDEDGCVTTWNTGAEQIHGYSKDEILGEHYRTFFPEEAVSAGRPEQLLTRAKAAGVAEGEHWRVRNDGSTFWGEFTLTALSDESGTLHGFANVTHDRTEQREREQKLTALHEVADDLTANASFEQACERTIEASQDILAFDLSVITIEEEGTLAPVAVSEDVPPEGMTAMTVDEGLTGKTYRTGDSFLVDDITTREDANPQGPYKSAISVPIAEHGVFQAVAHTTGAFDEGDLELVELLISHTKSALDRLTQEQRLERQNEQLDRFASVVSHDLRNPLNVAQGRLALAQEECDCEHLEAAVGSVDRSLTLIEDLLALARQGKQVSELESVALTDTLESVWQTIETAEATLVVRTDQRVRADPSRLKQLVENLLGNAIDHGGADVTITISELADGFAIADDGPGIPEDKRDQVFDAGYTTKDGGTGFGLNVVQGIADAHGWELTITGSETGGTRFEITGVEAVEPE
jgi:PAS domain S-box-containing protein